MPQSVGAGSAPATSTDAAAAASIPVLITGKMKDELKRLGYSDDDLYRMPADAAHRILEAGLRKRPQPASFTTRPSPSFPPFPSAAAARDEADDEPVDVLANIPPWAIGVCILLAAVVVALQFASQTHAVLVGN
ncbi:Aste57867_3970 [Aphanomyces stellatus]|uniref:Aste57867_3970 protein n=1 Tax=Aphanomyces stellatus TaxID=120398 RepID=A0A485KCB9_9STRA|nr:hypothetical protein As57867_003959 [Aphanomyces stellatus]VFT81107.1 Aste57867_3970 [Aphanomyces stellatus]